MIASLGSAAINSGGTAFFKFGFAPAVTSGGAPWDVWDGPTAIYPWPAAAAATTIVSTSAQDKGTVAVGTGAQLVVVIGLLADFTEATETAVMNGAGAVALANEYLRINRMYVLQAGTSESNVGVITAQHGAVVISTIELATVGGNGRGQTLQTIYTVPKGFNARAGSMSVDILRQAAAFAEVSMLIRTLIAPAVTPVIRTQVVRGVNSQGSSFASQERLPSLPSEVVWIEGTDIWLRAEDVSATVAIAGTFTVELVKTA